MKHPGELVRSECIDPNRLTVVDAAAILDVDRKTLSYLVNGKNGISPAMAVRLAIAFGGQAEAWLTLQMRYELAQVDRAKLRVRRFKRPTVREVS